jgi:CrcB protein
MMSGFIVVGIGAAIGGALRHAINLWSAHLLGLGFPCGILIVNVSGSLAMGLLAAYFVFKGEIPQAWRLFLTTGILGGFTTFSAFSLDVALLYERGQPCLALVYSIGSVVLSIAALFVGLWIVRQFT